MVIYIHTRVTALRRILIVSASMHKTSYILELIFFLVWFFRPQQEGFALTVTSQNTGNWSNTTTWGGVLPQAGDHVIIAAGTTVNLNQSTATALLSLTIQANGKLILTVNGSGIHINGDIINNGELTTFLNEGLKGTMFFEGNGSWSGSGIWNLSTVNLNSFNWEFADNLIVRIAGNISGAAGSSFNTVNRRINTQLYFNGSENAVLIADGTKYIYPSIVIDKPSPRTVAMLGSASANTVGIIGTINILKTTDVFSLGGYNSLVVDKNLLGSGSLSGSQSSDLWISGLGAEIVPLRFKNQTDFNSIRVTRPSGVTFENSFTVLNELFVDAFSKITLPSNATMTIGQNGANPTSGKLTCNGFMYAGSASGLTLRGNDALPVNLKFAQTTSTNYTLSDLDVSRAAGAGSVNLEDNTSLILNGALMIDAANQLNLKSCKLFLNSTITINIAGYFTGSDQSELYIQGTGGNATLRFNPNGSENNRSLKYLYLNRTPGRIITIANTLNITEQVNLISGKIDANDFLTLLSTASRNAGINTLSASASILGNVNVQSFFTGGLGMRGTRTVSSPINDVNTFSTFKQMQSYMYITGPGSGFDPMPLPVTPTIQTYFEPAKYDDGAASQFNFILNVDEKSPPGTGFFLRFRGDRSNANGNKLAPVNYAYAIPENVTVIFKGPVNQGNIATNVSHTPHNTHLLDAAYNGYNLIGNPYPSTINWELVSKTNMENIVSIIKPGGGMVTYSNGLVTNGGPPNTSTASSTPIASGLPFIQTGQGFYVRAKLGGGTVIFTENSKSVLASSSRLLSEPMNNRLQSKDTGERTTLLPKKQHHIRLELCDSKNSDETVIAFDKDFSASYGTADAAYFPGNSVSLASLTSDGQKVAINFMPEINRVNQIDLHVNANSSGDYRLNFKNVPLSASAIFLKDAYRQNELTEVRKGLSYPFIIEKNNKSTYGDKRFALILRPKESEQKKLFGSPQIVKISAFPNPVIDNVFFDVSSLPDEDLQLVLYNINGRKAVELTFNKNEMAVANFSFLKSGMYISKFRSLKNQTDLGELILLKH